jgi:hypothetical protein
VVLAVAATALFVTGGVVGAVAALAFADVIDLTWWNGGSANGSGTKDERPESLPGTAAGPLLRQLVDAGFTCSDAPSGLGECVFVRPDKRGRYVVRLSGPDPSRVVGVSTSLAVDTGDPAELTIGWLRVATTFRYEGADPMRALRWARAAFRRGEGTAVLGPVLLRLFTDEAGRPTLEIRARGAPREKLPELDLEALTARFAPVLRFPEDEAFRPISIEQFSAEASLSRFYVRGRFSPSAHIERERDRADAGPLPHKALRGCKGFSFCYYALDLRIAEPRAGTAPFASLQASVAEAPAIVYWNAVRDPSGDLALQYWFLYFYNGHRVNRHEGDWEQVTLHLDESLVPLELGYSSHHSGERKDWVDLVEGLNRVGDHAVVYVALGSHANYFAPGFGLGRECFLGVCKNGIDDISTRLDELPPEDYELVPLRGTPFAGNFGSGNFFWEGRFGWELDDLVVADPRLRRGFKQPLVFFEKAREAR